MKQGILNLSEKDLEIFFIQEGIPKFRASQVYSWLYRFGKTSFFDMTNIDKSLQKKLDDIFYIYHPNIERIQKSNDGTIKFLLELNDSDTVETVYIPSSKKRNTLCISSQVGCSVGCKFCNTGYNGFIRNLSAEEVIVQYLVVNKYLQNSHEKISNIVFMGMGEPLYNAKNVLFAIDIFSKLISRRKITLSTSGISVVLKEIATDLKCKLAISLHAPNDEIRSRIMPINNIYNIKSIMNACEIYHKNHEFLKITFEYLLLKGINDSKECAYELVDLIKNTNSRVNILMFNEWDGCVFKPSSSSALKNFVSILEKNGIEAPIRDRRGLDILAACGQLSRANSST
ncbi:MAG: 23S rRNA (adenine(2503)-C(2))-methyltransferase RlmN [Holosporales bacterium]|jgi:23S rRNA (adenine2503-C2)-methyltransferase|nr:23S rRNA (adenine(2503)-C(2))-methyltransferase RlmN [Holosporales bacterium]